jgi:hypothetical protein
MDTSVLFAGVDSVRPVIKFPSARFDSVIGTTSCTEMSYRCCGTRGGRKIWEYGCGPSLYVERGYYKHLKRHATPNTPILQMEWGFPADGSILPYQPASKDGHGYNEWDKQSQYKKRNDLGSDGAKGFNTIRNDGDEQI